jgi:hypothetical protein
MERSKSGLSIKEHVWLPIVRLKRRYGLSNGYRRREGVKRLLPLELTGVSLSTEKRLGARQAISGGSVWHGFGKLWLFFPIIQRLSARFLE